MKNSKVFLMALYFSMLSCSANKIKVHMEIVNSVGGPVRSATVKIVDNHRCCPANDVPCSYLTDEFGGLDIFFNAGRAFPKDSTRMHECEVVINKDGYKTLTEKFYFCWSGSCSGTQNINVRYKLLSPSQSE